MEGLVIEVETMVMEVETMADLVLETVLVAVGMVRQAAPLPAVT